MAEILLSNYDMFISRHMLTHATTNLSASEIESCYGNRVRSRLREMMNGIAFDQEAKDKRVCTCPIEVHVQVFMSCS